MGSVVAFPGDGDIGLTGRFVVLLLVVPVIVLDGEAAGLSEARRLIAALAMRPAGGRWSRS
jgi:hypothetical protein